MAFLALIIGAILIVVALNGTHAQLAKELESDVPGFFKWGAAIVVILAIGYVPGLKTPVRWLLALIVVALLAGNVGGITTNLIAAFKTFGTTGGSGGAAGGAGGSGLGNLAGGGQGASGGGSAGLGDVGQAINSIGQFLGSGAG